MTKKIYRTMQGREIDMESLMAKNETMPAIGNVRMNARGDELGPGGKIIKTKEQLMAEYYEDNPNAVVKSKNKKEENFDNEGSEQIIPTQTKQVIETNQVTETISDTTNLDRNKEEKSVLKLNKEKNYKEKNTTEDL